MKIPVNSRLLCSNENYITDSNEAPSFTKKNQITWNGTLRNTHITSGDGFLSTNGLGISYRETDTGAEVDYSNKKIKLDFEWLLEDKIKTNKNSSADLISSVYYNGWVYSLYKSDNLIELILTNGNEEKIIDLSDYKSAILSSTYYTTIPYLYLVKQEQLSQVSYKNYIYGYSLDKLEDLSNYQLYHQTTDYISLADANSATSVLIDGEIYNILGCDDIDHNRSRIFIWSTDNNNAQEIKWFGCVAPNGLITGEPVPDPDLFKYYSRNNNGTYSWDMKNGTGNYIAGQLIIGYEPPKDGSRRWKKIIVDSWSSAEVLRVNLTANDTKLEDDDIDPRLYFVSNFADSRGVYFDYGKGWAKCYIRKHNPTNKTISDCYIYTYGCKTTSNLPYRIESMMSKMEVANWPYNEGKLNTRTYHIGGNNKGTSSMLSSIPFTVVFDEDELLVEQIYGLSTLSFSWSKSLITPGADHSDFNIQYGDKIILSIDGITYIIGQDRSKFNIRKLADYMFITNILDSKNLLVEDSNGNISLEKTAVPYNMEAILDISDKNLTPPSASIQAANNTVYWACAYNSNFQDGRSTSYLFPAIAIPVFISSTQLTQYTTELLDERGTFIHPLLKGIFDDYEEVEVYYTLASNSTTITYRTTNVIKTTDITSDRYDLYGKETYDILKNGFIWSITTNTIYYPVAIGAIVNGINYITPTIELTKGYSVRLYLRSNQLMAGYLFMQQVYLGSNIFTIYGSNYYYDGQGIYYTGKDNYYTSNQFVCYTLGMRFLANSGSEAFFYSDFEKRLFIFTGSQVLQPSDSLSNMAPVIEAMFSSKEQTLYMLTEDGYLISRNSTDLAAIDLSDYNISHLEGTDSGCVVITDSGWINVSPYKGDSILPFILETPFFGSDERINKCSFIDIVLVKNKPCKFTFTFTALTGIEEKSQIEEVTINERDWQGNNYRYRITPRNNVANSFKIKIESEDEIIVSSIIIDLHKYGEQDAARSGRRSIISNR